MFKKLIILSITAVMLSGLSPARASAPVVEDQAGDANGTGAEEELLHRGPLADAPYAPGTAPVSYDPADLRRAWISTDYRTDPLGLDGLDHVATGITLHLVTEAPFDPEGPTLLYNFDLFGSGCDSHFVVERRGNHFLSTGSDGVWWAVDTACTPDPTDESDPNVIRGIYRHPDWTVTQDGAAIRISIPFASLEPWQMEVMGPGRLLAFGAETQAQFFVYPHMDSTAHTGAFTVGQDMPQDKPCSYC